MSQASPHLPTPGRKKVRGNSRPSRSDGDAHLCHVSRDKRRFCPQQLLHARSVLMVIKVSDRAVLPCK